MFDKFMTDIAYTQCWGIISSLLCWHLCTTRFILSGLLDLWQAVLIDIGSLLLVVGNGSMLLLDTSFELSDAPNEPERKVLIAQGQYNVPTSTWIIELTVWYWCVNCADDGVCCGCVVVGVMELFIHSLVTLYVLAVTTFIMSSINEMWCDGISISFCFIFTVCYALLFLPCIVSLWWMTRPVTVCMSCMLRTGVVIVVTSRRRGQWRQSRSLLVTLCIAPHCVLCRRSLSLSALSRWQEEYMSGRHVTRRRRRKNTRFLHHVDC